MQPYKNSSGNSGVIAYEILKNSIKIKFIDEEIYTYTYKSAGKPCIEKMKLLAIKGCGLSTYISRYVKHKFELHT